MSDYTITMSGDYLEAAFPSLLGDFDRHYNASTRNESNFYIIFRIFFGPKYLRFMNNADNMRDAIKFFCRDLKNSIYEYGARITGRQIDNSFVAPNWENYFPPQGEDWQSDIYKGLIQYVFKGTGTIPPNTDIDTIITNLEQTLNVFFKELYNLNPYVLVDLKSKYPNNVVLEFIEWLRWQFLKIRGIKMGYKGFKETGEGGSRRKSIRNKRRRSRFRSRSRS